MIDNCLLCVMMKNIIAIYYETTSRTVPIIKKIIIVVNTAALTDGATCSYRDDDRDTNRPTFSIQSTLESRNC